ncbi:hypothetical protein SAMN04488105_10547 [Salipiger thiooxidans]|uniref:Uncharacterized protein n=1 Tax=Salipiger thiooxidans TaxID=282683 RepID=A0A1G7E1F1_9RHOB|nr:hypothetical protein SAMN04488105_10547 [Salipiger thiooxidans]
MRAVPRFVRPRQRLQSSMAWRSCGGEGRPGIDPVDQFSPERAEPWEVHGMLTTVGESVVALARVIGTVGGDAADLLIRRDLAEQIGQNRCVADMVSCDFNGSDVQCLLVNPEMDLAPDPPLGTAMLAGVPLAFAINPDSGPSAASQGIAQHCPERDQQVQRPPGAAMGDVHGKGLLPATPASRRGIPSHLGVKPTSRDIAAQCTAGQRIVREPRRLSASL